MTLALEPITFSVNGESVTVLAKPVTRLTDVLRDSLGLTGTKVGCEAGDCGSCTILMDGAQVCACMIPAAQAAGSNIETIEGLATGEELTFLQSAFHRHGAAQCGICSPGMLMAATDLLRQNSRPTRREVEDAMGGVLCRCTGYVKIVDAVMDAAYGTDTGAVGQSGMAVGASLAKVDGIEKLTGAEKFGADVIPEGALALRIVRSPFASASFSVSDLRPLFKKYPGLVRVLSAVDIPGRNGYGIYPEIKDQPVLARNVARYRGDAILALVGDAETIRIIADDELPVTYYPADPVIGLDAALHKNAATIQKAYEGNILTRGYVCKGKEDPNERGEKPKPIDEGPIVAEATWQTSFVEHAYIEPEAGFARRVGDRIEITAATQAPYMDREEIAAVLDVEPAQVRIIPTACGGGFGGKLDVSVQPIIAVAAWLLDQPVRCVYTRPESMAATTKRHPARLQARASCDEQGLLTSYELQGDFITGAYASWGPTVADRVPIHATGPYRVPVVEVESTAVLTNEPPAGAFRGFGVPQCAIAHEGIMDMLAEKTRIDPLEFRLLNAIRVGDETATGQVLDASVGIDKCLEALRPYWSKARGQADMFNERSRRRRLGVGLGCMWYGCGNTSISNPSTIRVGMDATGMVTLYSGAVDIGQGVSTILTQICADAIGVPVTSIRLVTGDTDLTADAGKTSASRQTFISGRATQLAAEDMRAKILRLANVGPHGLIEVEPDALFVRDVHSQRRIELNTLSPDEQGNVLTGEGTFDPPTTPLDDDGQGSPYATYAFAAQMAEIEADLDLGTVKVRRVVAAHDVGRAINPIQVEGQIHGGIAQGLGMALMEEYVPGRSENLHDYLIPTFGDMPDIEIMIIEEHEPLGPFGAKGIGEPALIPTAPAILGAISHAIGTRIYQVPATPDRVRAAILAARTGSGRD
ncbi:MAG: molybdopterin-dependent oxidoreductase [Alphaproteobacteria bacterium]|nr:molybdopterin-dependent oxidoreductase [Alphaproteobacteria bacterium]